MRNLLPGSSAFNIYELAKGTSCIETKVLAAIIIFVRAMNAELNFLLVPF